MTAPNTYIVALISLKRELPEALKPRKIAINDTNLIQSKPSRKAKAA